eukprot:Nk52_evm44s255 gene=Nk52_evmTU44s255
MSSRKGAKKDKGKRRTKTGYSSPPAIGGQIFQNALFHLYGFNSARKKELASLIEAYGGHYTPIWNEKSTYLVTTWAEVRSGSDRVLEAVQHEVPVLDEEFIRMCISRKMILDYDEYDLVGLLEVKVADGEVEQTQEICALLRSLSVANHSRRSSKTDTGHFADDESITSGNEFERQESAGGSYFPSPSGSSSNIYTLGSARKNRKTQASSCGTRAISAQSSVEGKGKQSRRNSDGCPVLGQSASGLSTGTFERSRSYLDFAQGDELSRTGSWEEGSAEGNSGASPFLRHEDLVNVQGKAGGKSLKKSNSNTKSSVLKWKESFLVNEYTGHTSEVVASHMPSSMGSTLESHEQLEMTLSPSQSFSDLKSFPGLGLTGSVDNVFPEERAMWYKTVTEFVKSSAETHQKLNEARDSNLDLREDSRKMLGSKLWLEVKAFCGGKSVEEELKWLVDKRQEVPEFMKSVFDFSGDMNSSLKKEFWTSVEVLLEKSFFYESLWPTMADMEKEYPSYFRPPFSLRLGALWAWLSATKCLSLKHEALVAWTGARPFIIHSGKRTEREDQSFSLLGDDAGGASGFGFACKTQACASFIDKNLKHLGLGKLIDTLMTILNTDLEFAKRNLSLDSEFRRINLPSFEPLYRYMANISIGIIQMCLHSRLQHFSIYQNASVLSIQQLVVEFKEALQKAVYVKNSHIIMIDVRIHLKEDYDSAYDFLDKILSDTLSAYYGLIWSWFQVLQKFPEASGNFKDVLEEEWNFVKGIYPHVQEGEAQAARHFCVMAEALFDDTKQYLEEGLVSCCSGSNSFLVESRATRMLFDKVRSRSLKALGFAKLISKDLEISADFSITVPKKQLYTQLVDTGHVLVVNKGYQSISSEFDLVVHRRFSEHLDQIEQLLSSCSGIQEEIVDQLDLDGYILIIATDVGSKQSVGEPGSRQNFIWNGPTAIMKSLKAGTVLALADMKVNTGNLKLIACSSRSLHPERKAFEKCAEGCVEVLVEQIASHRSVQECVTDMKQAALILGEEKLKSVRFVRAHFEAVSADEREQHIHGQPNVVFACFGLFMKYCEELSRLIVGRFRPLLGRFIISYAKEWADLVTASDEDVIKYLTPTLSLNALQFTVCACNPLYTCVLGKEEFALFREDIDTMLKRLKVRDLFVVRQIENFGSQSSLTRALSYKTKSGFSINDDDCVANSHSETSKDNNTLKRIRMLEDRRYKRLKDVGFVGNVVNITDSGYEERGIYENANGYTDSDSSGNEQETARSVVGFKWQRGKFLAKGAFGSVYLCVNLNNGVLMAVKDIKLSAHESRAAIKRITKEVRIIEKIHNEHIVRYYGIETHKTALFVFMEYCSGGSISSLLGSGKIENEYVIRNYTRQILLALDHLHGLGIAHRDIKGDNIFITASGILKLGDFGTCVKLKDCAQTRQGEINSLTGTPAYMAPEVITGEKDDGHGRKADIWSLGCTVIEMTTGKRPWHNLENEWAILYHVGVSKSHPPFPESVSDDGRKFLQLCFEINPEFRASSHSLLIHPYVVFEES